MKKSCRPIHYAFPAIYSAFNLFIFLSVSSVSIAQTTATEKKVDYLERIYFSGENREGLNTKILVALQEIQEKAPTPALAKQVTFLLEIKDRANSADDACDVLDLLAVGIYNIDAAEAVQQGVLPPSDKAKVKSADALASLNKLNSTTANLGASARNLEWSSYLLSGGKYGSFAAGAGKVANAAGTIGTVAGTAVQVGHTAKQLGELGESLGISFKKKDKPCDDVSKKEIIIGEHLGLIASTNTVSGGSTSVNTNSGTNLTTVISIRGISSAHLRTLTDTLRTKSGVQSAEKSYNETLSTIAVVHSGTTDGLADWFEDKFSAKFKIVDYVAGKINIAIKSK